MQYVTGCQNYVSIHQEGRSAKRRHSRPRNGSHAAPRFGYLKLAVIAFISFVVFSGFAIAHTVASVSTLIPADASETTVIVSAGDTLWDLASRYAGDGTDVRKVVYAIKKRNNLSASSVVVGQTLIIPAVE